MTRPSQTGAPEGLWEAHRGGLIEDGRSNTRHRKHCFDAGYGAALAAAREAVEGVTNEWELRPGSMGTALMQDALAAIRALEVK